MAQGINQNHQASQETNQRETTGELPEQEFITEEIEEKEVLVSEDFMVEWVPTSIQANATTVNLEIIRPIFLAIKRADKTVVEKDEIITYTVIIKNVGKTAGNAIIKDVIDQKTEFVADSIEIDGNKTKYTLEDFENGKISVTIPKEGEVKLLFKVKSIAQLKSDEKIKNVAYVNNIPTNEMVIDMPNIKVEKNVFMKNGETIPEDQLNTITFDENDIVGYKIKVTNTGTIKLNNVTLVDILENEKQIFLDVNKPTEKTNTVVDYDEELSLEPNESKEYIVYYKVEKDDVKNVSKKDSLKNKVTATGYYINDNNEEKSVDDEDNAKIKFTAKPDISIVKTQKVGDKKLDANGYLENSNADSRERELVKLKPDDIIDYTITIKNKGNKKLTGIVVTDIMNDNPTNGTRNVTIKTVKVENKNRDYTVNSDGSLSINGELNVNETLVITASYKVVETDMSSEKAETIKNTAKVVTNETEPKESSVEAKTLIYKPIITISKTGKLADGITDANEKTLKYGDTVTYILTAKNTGTKYDTVTIKDADIKTLVNNGNVQITSNVIVEHFNKNGSKKTETITENKVKALAEDGIKVYVPAGEKATVTFTVKITATPGTEIVNTVVDGEGTVTNYVEKEVTAISSSKKDKNFVIILDLSSSMLYKGSSDSYGEVFNAAYRDTDYSKTTPVVQNLNNDSDTKLANAKKAIKNFAKKVLEINPNNQITLITFNFKSKAIAEACFKVDLNSENQTAKTNAERHLYILNNHSFASNYIGTHTLLTAESKYTNIENEINKIKITHPLLTDVVAAMTETENVIKNTLSKDKTRDIEVIFLGDGKPSYTGEACATNGFYNKTDTLNNITTIASRIKNTYKAKIYTISYEIPSSQQTDANNVFNAMASGDAYKITSNSSEIEKKLENIGKANTSGLDERTFKTDEDGKAVISLNEKNINSNLPVTLTITPANGTAKEYTFNSIADINKTGNGVNTATKQVIQYNQTNKVFTIYANNIDASATISLRYYYTSN